MSLPLRGLRVLDMSRVLAGPWCTMLLGDAGATVIKLEKTGKGDDTRSWGPPFLGDTKNNKISTYFLALNRGKRSIAVDIKRTEGLDICRRLATEWADVLVENFKGGTMKRMGLDYESLHSVNPRLIYCSITGFGSSGPFAERPGYDVIVSGMYGLMSITGEENGNPAKVGVAATDVLTGTLAQSGILAALYERERTGYGKQVEVSLMESQLAGLVNIASSTLNARDGTPEPRRWGTAHESIVPYQAFKCKTFNGNVEYIMVGAGNDHQFAMLCKDMGVPMLATDPRFKTNADRVRNRDILVKLLEGRFKEKSRDDWVQLLAGKPFPSGPLRTVSEAFQCEQATHRGMIEEMDHPVVGKIKLPRTPISFLPPKTLFPGNHEVYSKHDSAERLPPPMLGQHTEEILTDLLNMSRTDVDRLERSGVINCWRGDPISSDDCTN